MQLHGRGNRKLCGADLVAQTDVHDFFGERCQTVFRPAFQDVGDLCFDVGIVKELGTPARYLSILLKLFPIPGQTYSLKYLEVVAGKVSGSFYVGGHSKGGNLAICAAMQCAAEIQERIIKIYNMDGPGFRPEVLKQFDYEKIAGRIVKILPHSSLIGMIFETDTRYHVVESKGFGLLQHDPYTWLVKDGGFVYAKDLYRSSKFTNSTINEWVLSLDEEHLKTFVNTVFQVLSASQAKDLIEFTADWRKSMNGVIAALREVDDETKKILKDMIKALAVLGRKRLINTQLKGVGAESTKQKISSGSTGRRSMKKRE